MFLISNGIEAMIDLKWNSIINNYYYYYSNRAGHSIQPDNNFLIEIT